jgi:16S rRNA (cytidine1402-2'-O)-methyltransferase
LWLGPNTLDLGTGHETPLDQLLPRGVIERAAMLGHWVVENAKSARALLKRVDALVPLAQPLQQVQITELPRPRKDGRTDADAQAYDQLLRPALHGHDLGLLSEAGLPAVADPGSRLVQAAHRNGVAVEPMSGPSSLLMALAASGLNGQSFAFVGYLPVDASARAARIRELDALSRRSQQTQLAIETPYRNAALRAALIEHLQPGTQLAVASGLTLAGGSCISWPVQRWRREAPMLDDRLPAVYAWLG